VTSLSPLRVLVSHSTRDTRPPILWRFIEETQRVLDLQCALLRLVVVVSECGGKVVEALSDQLRAATAATDLTMMVLTPAYVASNWCDDEMHERSRHTCCDCPSRRLFPLVWGGYTATEIWGRRIDGWGVDLRSLLTDSVLDAVDSHLWEPTVRPTEWLQAIEKTAAALARFSEEIRTTCVKGDCPHPVPTDVPIPHRLD
jgi:hypothetical protein